jgi:hypothetical protein
MRSQTKNVFRIHLGLLLAEIICIPAFIIEVFRALGGNDLSWAYVFEWPLLGIYAIYMWRKLLLEERGVVKEKKRTERNSTKEDARLEEWNTYLASVHQSQPASPEHRND